MVKLLAKLALSDVPSPDPAPAVQNCLELAHFTFYNNGWLLDGEVRQHSPKTRAARRMVLDNLLWFLKQAELQQDSRVKPSLIAAYHARLRAFFAWAVREGAVAASPMAVFPQVSRADQICLFSPKPLEVVLAAARRTRQT